MANFKRMALIAALVATTVGSVSPAFAQSRTRAAGSSANRAQANASATANQSSRLNADSDSSSATSNSMRRSTRNPFGQVKAYPWNFNLQAHTEAVLRDGASSILRGLAVVSASNDGFITIQKNSKKITMGISPVRQVVILRGLRTNHYLIALSGTQIEIVKINQSGITPVALENAPNDLLQATIAYHTTPLIGRVTVTDIKRNAKNEYLVQLRFPDRASVNAVWMNRSEVEILMKAAQAKIPTDIIGLSRVILTPTPGLSATTLVQRLSGTEVHELPKVARINEIFDTILKDVLAAKQPNLTKFSEAELRIAGLVTLDQSDRLRAAVDTVSGGKVSVTVAVDRTRAGTPRHLLLQVNHPDLGDQKIYINMRTFESSISED